jgi:hypothetical protein
LTPRTPPQSIAGVTAANRPAATGTAGELAGDTVEPAVHAASMHRPATAATTLTLRNISFTPRPENAPAYPPF